MARLRPRPEVLRWRLQVPRGAKTLTFILAAGPPLGFFKGGHFNLGKRPGSSCCRSERRALVEILVSHLSAQNAERWGTRRLGEGEI